MLALVIAILRTTSFSLIIRHTQRLGYNQMGVMAVNYLTAATLGFVVAYRRGACRASPTTLHIGLTAGFIFVGTYLLFMHALSLRGVAISNAITRVSVVVPVAAAVLIWGERPRAIEEIGALLALLAMPMLSLDKGVGTLALSQPPDRPVHRPVLHQRRLLTDRQMVPRGRGHGGASHVFRHPVRRRRGHRHRAVAVVGPALLGAASRLGDGPGHGQLHHQRHAHPVA